jgi:cobalt-zinc-cadmium efflux system membrane fusion protein
MVVSRSCPLGPKKTQMNFEHAVPQMTRARQIRVLALSVAAVALVAAGASGLRAWLHQPEPALSRCPPVKSS